MICHLCEENVGYHTWTLSDGDPDDEVPIPVCKSCEEVIRQRFNQGRP